MRQVADKVYVLGSRTHNYYLIVEDEEVTVIDAGCARERPKLEADLLLPGHSDPWSGSPSDAVALAHS